MLLFLFHIFSIQVHFFYMFLKKDFLLKSDIALTGTKVSLRLGGCLNGAMGASTNTGFSSGFLNINDLKCLVRTELIFGRKGLKLNGAIIIIMTFLLLL